MRREVMEYIRLKPDLHRYLRENPSWYRILGRNPERLREFEGLALYAYEKTIPQRIDKLTRSVQMGLMMYNMLQAMNREG